MPRTTISTDLLSNTVVASFSYELLSASIAVPAGSVVSEAKVDITEAFDGSPSAAFQAGSGTTLIPSADMAIDGVNTFICVKPFMAVADDTVEVVVTASSPTQGYGLLVVTMASTRES